MFYIFFLDVLLEPVGLRVPRMNSELKGGSMEKSVGSAFSLLCEAQGYPTPTFR